MRTSPFLVKDAAGCIMAAGKNTTQCTRLLVMPNQLNSACGYRFSCNSCLITGAQQDAATGTSCDAITRRPDYA